MGSPNKNQNSSKININSTIQFPPLQQHILPDNESKSKLSHPCLSNSDNQLKSVTNPNQEGVSISISKDINQQQNNNNKIQHAHLTKMNDITTIHQPRQGNLRQICSRNYYDVASTNYSDQGTLHDTSRTISHMSRTTSIWESSTSSLQVHQCVPQPFNQTAINSQQKSSNEMQHMDKINTYILQNLSK